MNLKFTAKQMNDNLRKNVLPISEFWDEVNYHLEKTYKEKAYRRIYIDTVHLMTPYQPKWDEKELKQAIKELRKAGFRVEDCDTFLSISF